MRNALGLFVLVLLAGTVHAADVAATEKPVKPKKTLADYLQHERDGDYDEPELPTGEQFDGIALRFSVYMICAKTEAEKDAVDACMAVVCDRVKNRAGLRERDRRVR